MTLHCDVARPASLGPRHLREYFLAQGGSWQDKDLTAIAINSQTLTAGATLPERSSPLDGYWQSGDSSQHVNFIDNTGHVHELFIHPGAGWVDNDLFQASILTGATAAGPRSQLDGYPEASDNSQHVNFIAANGHVHELFFPQGGPWQDNDLTHNAVNGTPAQAGSHLHGYTEASDGSQHVNFTDANFHLHELFINPGSNGWIDNDLTNKAANGTPAVADGALGGYWDATDDTQHVNFIDANGLVHELFF